MTLKSGCPPTPPRTWPVSAVPLQSAPLPRTPGQGWPAASRSEQHSRVVSTLPDHSGPAARKSFVQPALNGVGGAYKENAGKRTTMCNAGGYEADRDDAAHVDQRMPSFIASITRIAASGTPFNRSTTRSHRRLTDGKATAMSHRRRPGRSSASSVARNALAYVSRSTKLRRRPRPTTSPRWVW